MSDDNDIRHGRHCVFKIHVHLVFVAKYRRGVFDGDAINRLRTIFAKVCTDFEAQLIETALCNMLNHQTLIATKAARVSLAAEGGLKEIARLAQASDQMERRLRGRRASSSLPAAIELVLQRPVVSAEMVAQAAKVTPRGALNLIADLGVREMTGRGRYRAWGIL